LPRVIGGGADLRLSVGVAEAQRGRPGGAAAAAAVAARPRGGRLAHGRQLALGGPAARALGGQLGRGGRARRRQLAVVARRDLRDILRGARRRRGHAHAW